MWLTKSCIQLTAHTLRTVGFPFPPYSAALHQARYRSALHDGWRDEHFAWFHPRKVNRQWPLKFIIQSHSIIRRYVSRVTDTSNNSTLCIPSYWHIQQFDAMHPELLTHPTIRRYSSQFTDTSNNSTRCIPSYWHIQQFDAMHPDLLTHPTIRCYASRVTDISNNSTLCIPSY